MMSEDDSAGSLKTWLGAYSSESGAVNVSLSRDGELISFSDVQGGSGVALTLSPCFGEGGNGAPETLYRYRLLNETADADSSPGQLEVWQRYVYVVEAVGNNGRRVASEDNEYLLEIETRSDAQIGPPPAETVEILLDEVLTEGSSAGSLRASRVAGLEEQKEALRNFLLQTPEDWGLEAQTGIILEGPPGTGKTELVIEVCRELYGEVPVTISGPEILSRWVGESERILRDRFEEARGHTNPVIYIDELDAIARSRSDVSQEHSAQIVAQLLVLLDGITSKRRHTASGDGHESATKPVKVIASTNLAEVVDPALKRPGRLGDEPIEFKHPTEEERKAIIHHYLEQVRRAGKLGEELTRFVKAPDEGSEKLLEGLAGLTGAGLEEVVRTAVANAQEIDSDVLEWGHFEAAVQATRIVGAEHEQVLSDEQVAGIQAAKLVFVDSVRNQIDESRLQSLVDEYADRDDNYRKVSIDLSTVIGHESNTLAERLEELRQDAGGAAICLHIERAPDVLEAASQGLPAARQTVQTLQRELLAWTDDSVAFLLANPEHMNALFPAGLYYQL